MVFSPVDVTMRMFARFAQAINLLHQVLKHISEIKTTLDDAFDSQRAMQLDETIRSLVNLTRSESHFRQTEACLQIATCYSLIGIYLKPHETYGSLMSQ
jgi:hypothetical protein